MWDDKLLIFLAHLQVNCQVNVIKRIAALKMCKYSPTCLLNVGRYFTSHVWMSKKVICTIVHVSAEFKPTFLYKLLLTHLSFAATLDNLQNSGRKNSISKQEVPVACWPCLCKSLLRSRSVQHLSCVLQTDIVCNIRHCS